MAVVRTAKGLPSQPSSRAKADEIAKALNLTPAEVIDALQAGTALDVRSLDEPSAATGDRLGAHDAGFELVEDRSVIDRAWRSLDPRERESLVLRLVHDLTYREIADRLGMSVTHVVRLVSRSLKRLQAVAKASDPR
jgi:RNA polymerase sigma-B factor